MKKITAAALVVLCAFIFTGCFNKNDIAIHLITDDIALLDIVDFYNAATEANRIEVTYISREELEGRSIFKYVEETRVMYDIVAGSYYPDVILKDLDSAVLPGYIENSDSSFFPYFYDFLAKNGNLGAPYALDFPVIIGQGTVEELKKSVKLSLQEFRSLAAGLNKESEQKVEKIGFIPSVSYVDELDYYFMLGSTISKGKGGLSFISDESRAAFDYYHHFNAPGFPEEKINAYLDRYKKMDKKYYLKENVVSYGIGYFSTITRKMREKNTIALIEDLETIGLRSKVIGVNNKSVVKKTCFKFAAFLLAEKQQDHLLKSSYKLPSVYNTVHMPVRKNILTGQSGFIIAPVILENYIDRLRYINFHDPESQKKFFNAYFHSRSMVQKEIIQKEVFLQFFSAQLKK